MASFANGSITASFDYNGLGNRYQQRVDGVTTTYVLDIATSLSQVLSDGTKTYLYGMGRIAQESATDITYFLPDALGSVRQIADSSGGIPFAQSFDPFGNLQTQSGRATTTYGFAGEWTDQSGLQHLRARYYASNQGHFLSRDPFPGFLGVPATQHPYAYAFNNPVLYTDPSGEFVFVFAAVMATAIAGGLLGGLTYYAIQAYTNPCVDWDWGEAGKWIGIGGGLGALSGLTIYGGWWLVTRAIVPFATSVYYWLMRGLQRLYELRMAYEQEVHSILEKAYAKGPPSEQIARWAHATRRALGVEYKDMTPLPLRLVTYLRNIIKYGDKLGPTFERVATKYANSWETIINKAASPGGEDLLLHLLKRLFER